MTFHVRLLHILDVAPATARRLAERVDLLLSGESQAVETSGEEAYAVPRLRGVAAGAAPGPRDVPTAAAPPWNGRLGQGIALDCAQAAKLATSADQLLAGGRAEEALRIYRHQLLPLYQAFAALPPRGLIVSKIAEALAQLEGPGAPGESGGPAGLDSPP
ncbi:MAG: hypothetical protein JOZ15_05035 [Acidobacteria bacterium]|nr:hypothetical protein [Acidobacteriota bacterium]